MRKAASEGLIALLTEDGKAEEMVRDTGGSLLVTEMMLYADAGKLALLSRCTMSLVLTFRVDKSEAMEALLTPLSASYPATDEAKPHAIDVPHTSRVYKTLLQGGHFSQQTKTVVLAPSFSPSAFASAWIKTVGRESTVAMAQGGGAFVVAALCERVKEEGTEDEKAELRRWFSKKLKKDIRESQVKGKDFLLATVDALDT